VAATSGINVSVKLLLAAKEMEADLQLLLTKRRGTFLPVWQPEPRIEQIVVTPALKRWEVMHSLVLVYRDAYFSQLVDRYQPKWQEYKRSARDAREILIASGIGLVNDPIVRPAPPELSSSPGPQLGGTFYASAAWVNFRNQEGASSLASSITVTDGNLMQVGVTNAPANASGFNVYAGSSLDKMFQQNDVPIPVTAGYVYAPGQIVAGRLPGTGQTPDFTYQLVRLLPRG
jgi:hypothetical protein